MIRYQMATPPDRISPGLAPLYSKPTERRDGRILIVEDEYLISLVIEETLLDAGFEVLGIVTTGEEAVAEGIRLRPDLVLMDLRLAGEMTGVEAAFKLRDQGISCLFVSAHSDPGTRASGEGAKPVGWVAKPFTSSVLKTAVEAGLASLRRS